MKRSESSAPWWWPAGRVRRVVAQPLSKFRRRAVILLYHRVAHLPSDPFSLAVAPDRFAQQLEVIGKNYRPLRLTELADAVRVGEVPKRGVVITFDDGYLDNLEQACPRLEEAGIPATVFAATDFIKTRRNFWWDELEYLLMMADNDERSLTLTVGNERRSWRTESFEKRWKALHELKDWLRTRPADEVIEAQVAIRRWAGEKGDEIPLPYHRPMGVAQLERLSASDLLEVGAHTRRHPSLAHQGRSLQEEEISGCRDDLQEWLGITATSFAYPYGSPGADYSHSTKTIVAEAGYRQAVANRRGPVTSKSDIYELPRNIVCDWDGPTFAAWLRDRFADRAH